MHRGFYIAANGIFNQQRILNVGANNMANAYTAGFKSDQTITTTFDERLLLAKGRREGEMYQSPGGTTLVGNTSRYRNKNIGGNIVYGTIDYQQTDLTQGNLEFTDRRLDIALQGNVYFSVDPANTNSTAEKEGPFLSRDGQLQLDNEGYLTSPGTGRILDDGGNPIQLSTADFSVDNTGLITTAEGETFQLGLYYLPPDADVIKVSDNLFIPGEDVEALAALPDGEVYDVIQGAYEMSNVDMGKLMTKQMETQRLFESCAKMLQMHDQMNQRAIQELARSGR